MKLIHLSLLVALGVAAAACNVFSPLDKPSGDAQLLSAARACLNRGDYPCASTYYQQLSPAYADVAASEQVYLVLDQQGATMGALANFVGNGAGGSALTTFAETMSSGAGQAKRMAIFNALATMPYATSPLNRTDLQNFVVFLSSLALTAELLGEVAATHGGLLYQTDINNTGLLTTNSNAFNATASGFNTSYVSADQVYFAMQYAQNALAALNPSGSFGGTNSSFQSTLVGQPSTSTCLNVSAPCQTPFRTALTTGFGVGR